MPVTVTPLDQSLSYCYCPSCRANGQPKVILSRNQHEFKCPVGHGPFVWAQLQQMNAEMVPMIDVMQEQPDQRCIAQKVFILPDTWQKFNEKFRGRVWVTLGTMMEALSVGEFIIITGADAAKLKAKGLNNSQQVLAALESMAKLEQERDQAVEERARILNMLRQEGITT